MAQFPLNCSSPFRVILLGLPMTITHHPPPPSFRATIRSTDSIPENQTRSPPMDRYVTKLRVIKSQAWDWAEVFSVSSSQIAYLNLFRQKMQQMGLSKPEAKSRCTSEIVISRTSNDVTRYRPLSIGSLLPFSSMSGSLHFSVLASPSGTLS